MGELLEGASGFIIHSHIHPVNGALAVALASPGYANEVGDSWGGEGKGGGAAGILRVWRIRRPMIVERENEIETWEIGMSVIDGA